MSSAHSLESSVDLMVELGIYTQEKALKVEHSLDDAVYAFDDLTDVIAQNPEIMDTIKRVVAEKKKGV